MEVTVTKLTHEDLVTILSTGLYGCDWLSADYDSDFRESIPAENRHESCFEDCLADCLLNGGCIVLIDYYAEGELYGNVSAMLDDDENGMYRVYLEDFLRACSEGMEYAEALLGENPTGDYYDGNNLIQIAMFEEVIYG